MISYSCTTKIQSHIYSYYLLPRTTYPKRFRQACVIQSRSFLTQAMAAQVATLSARLKSINLQQNGKTPAYRLGTKSIAHAYLVCIHVCMLMCVNRPATILPRLYHRWVTCCTELSDFSTSVLYRPIRLLNLSRYTAHTHHCFGMHLVIAFVQRFDVCVNGALKLHSGLRWERWRYRSRRTSGWGYSSRRAFKY